MTTIIYLRPGQSPSTNISVTDPTAAPGSSASPTGWMADDFRRRIVRPASLDEVAEPIIFSTGVHHRWLDESQPPPLRRRIASLDETVEPINFSTGVHHRWLDEVTRPLPRRHTVSLDETAFVPFISTPAPSPYGWFPSDQQVVRRKYQRRLDEITVPLGQALPSIPVAPAWFMQSEQPQAPKARYIANVGPCHWTVVFPVYPPPSLPAVPTDFISGQRMIGWY